MIPVNTILDFLPAPYINLKVGRCLAIIGTEGTPQAAMEAFGLEENHFLQDIPYQSGLLPQFWQTVIPISDG
jgi:hypothetical protein